MTSVLVFNRNFYRLLYRRYLSIALTVAILLHLAVIATYYVASSFSVKEPVVMIRLNPFDLPPPPSIDPTNNLPPVNFKMPTAIGKGIPVPVPDAEVNLEATIASQTELSQQTSTINDILSGQSNVEFIEEDIVIEEEPALDTFIPVEKLPVPVKKVQPDYPEIARRAGVEGTVWVKILVDKEGKAKKAVIVKSDSEIFNEPAKVAAMQWVFTPAMMNNGPVAVWAAIPFHFKLNK
ncbi:MAG: TonB family protein [Patescibacteria group bacterium]